MAKASETFSTGGIRRAVIYRHGARPGLRTALWLSLAPGLDAAHPLHRAAGLWLLQTRTGEVGCYASTSVSTGRSTGGRVLHDLQFLDAEHEWLPALANALARVRGARSVAAAEQATLRRALAAFSAELDADALAAVRTEGIATAAVYNHYAAPGGTTGRNRVQAALSHPRFAAHLRQDWQLRRAVDHGRPLVLRLSEHFEVGAATIRRLRALPKSVLPEPLAPALLRYADPLPAAAIPKTAGDWSVFSRLAHGLEDLVRRAGIGRSAVLAPFRQGWAAGLADLEQRLGGPLDLDAIMEMMQCAYRYGVRPALEEVLAERGSTVELPPSPPAAFFPLWFAQYGLLRLARMAQQWSEAHARLSLQRLGAAEDVVRAPALRWPSFLDGGATHAGLRVVELTSYASLALEGERMDHCVASYAVKCLTSDSAIFSIRTQTGAPLSTFEARVPCGEPPIVVQHRGPGNALPDAMQRELAQRFVAHVLGQTSPSRIAAVDRDRRALGRRVRGLLGKPDTFQEPLTEQEMQELAKAAAPLHPAQARRAGLMPYLSTQGRDLLIAMGAT